MKDSLKGKTALITGAAAGIGRQVAQDLFAREHCRLILVDRNKAGAQQLADQLLRDAKTKKSEESQTIQVFGCDISLDQEVETLGEIEKVDILINNAGLTFNGTFETSSVADFQRIIDTNLMGTIRVTKAVLPALLKSYSSSIINIVSLAGLIGAPGMCPYSTSKFGVMGFSEALSMELHGRVHVCTVCPSFVKTDIALNAAFSDDVSEVDRQGTVSRMDDIVRKFGTSPRRVSARIIRAIKKKERLSVINPEANALYFLKRMAPALTESVVSRVYEKLHGRGVFRS